MSDGYQKQRLTNYLAGANEDAIGAAGNDWRLKGRVLKAVSEALQKEGPTLAAKLGKDSKTAAELKAALLSAGASMTTTATKLEHAGDALILVGDNLEKARLSRKAMKTLVEPPPYTAPSYNGVQPTPEQIQQDANQRAASNSAHTSYQTAYAGQEADAAEITANLDQAFLGAIPPMMAIHGGPDPTAPTPGDKDGPGTTAPPPVRRTRDHGVFVRPLFEVDRDEEREERERERREREEREERERRDRERLERERAERERDRLEQERLERERLERERLERERLERERLERLREQETGVITKHPTTNVAGGTDSGAYYQGVSDGASTSGSATGTSAGVGGAAAAGAAGAGLGAGAMKGGAIGGSAAAPIGGTVRGIGAGGQSASSSFSRSTAAGARGGAVSGSTSSAAGRSTAAGSASRSAGAGGRAGATGSSSAARGNGGASRGSAARAGAAGSTSGKGSAKGKGKGLFRRGSNGSTAGGRSNKSGDDRSKPRDALVYEQDWLGDETAAPSVLD